MQVLLSQPHNVKNFSITYNKTKKKNIKNSWKSCGLEAHALSITELHGSLILQDSLLQMLQQV
jgi:hypothetical protein